MKKSIVSILLCLGLVACSGSPTVKDTTTAKDTTATTATTETQPTTTEASKNEAGLGKTLVFNNFELTVKEVKRIKTFEGKPAIRIIYDFKNLQDDPIMPIVASHIIAYQKGIELGMAVTEDASDKSSKNIKKDVVITDVYADYESNPDDGDITIEVQPLINFDSSNKLEFTVPYPAE